MSNQQQKFNPIRLFNARMDEHTVGDNSSVIFWGIVDPNSLGDLLTDDYQREALNNRKVTKLKKVMAEGGRVPDIELGMRGEDFEETTNGLLLRNPVFIIDGYQRVTAGMRLLADPAEEASPHIAAVVFLKTTEAWERKRFQDVNLGQTPVSANVTLYNMRKDVPAVRVLYDLTTKDAFVMHDKVCWTQNMRRSDLINARTYFKTVGWLHSHTGPGGKNSNVQDIANGLQKIMERVSRNTLINNSKLFFNIVDECFGIQKIAFREGATYLRENFLRALALMFSKHTDFWDGSDDYTLTIPTDHLKRLAGFPTDDPHIVKLAAASGTAADLLLGYLLEHMNYRKTTRRLRPRQPLDLPEIEEDEGNGD